MPAAYFVRLRSIGAHVGQSLEPTGHAAYLRRVRFAPVALPSSSPAALNVLAIVGHAFGILREAAVHIWWPTSRSAYMRRGAHLAHLRPRADRLAFLGFSRPEGALDC